MGEFMKVSLKMAPCVLLTILLIVSGCDGKQGQEQPDESQSDAIKVDINIYHPGNVLMGIGEPLKVSRELADEWEALHPGKHIKYHRVLQASQSGAEGEWLKTQFIGGLAPEIISMNAETTWQDVNKGWYVPLDEFMERPNPYVEGNEHWIDLFLNQALVQAKRAPDGKLYCVPIDIVETGLYYNKDILRKLGIDSLPETWAEMMDTMERIQDAHYTPFTAPGGFASDWGQDILFEMVYHGILPVMDMKPSRPEAAEYLEHYLEPAEAGFLFTKGFFTRRDPRWREMNRLLYEWRQVWAKELKYSDPVRLFLTQRLVFIWSPSSQIRQMALDPYVDFDWGVTYLPPLTKASTPYATGSPATVIGGAALQLHVTNSALNNGNLEEVVDFLMFLSAPENIERLTSEAMFFIPNIKGTQADPRLKPFEEIFQRQYCAIKWLDSMDGRYKKYWRRMLDYYLNDGLTLDEYLERMEDNFDGWVASHREEEGWDFEMMEQTWKKNESQLLRELNNGE